MSLTYGVLRAVGAAVATGVVSPEERSAGAPFHLWRGFMIEDRERELQRRWPRDRSQIGARVFNHNWLLCWAGTLGSEPQACG
jgi:hypothetical protein